MDRIREFLASATIVSLDGTLAPSAGLIRRTGNIELGDACIAATALAYGATLLTRNIDDFKRVPDLSIEKI